MDIKNLPFCITSWVDIEPIIHTGDTDFLRGELKNLEISE